MCFLCVVVSSNREIITGKGIVMFATGILCKDYKKNKSNEDLFHVFSLRRERDSNPRNLSVQRFSRPPQSTTLPSLLYVW